MNPKALTHAVRSGILTNNQYRGLHLWVERNLGKPNRCETCQKTEGSSRSFHWANISGEYKKDLSDWKRLCAKCHFKVDNHASRPGGPGFIRSFCKRGHAMTDDNAKVKKLKKNGGSNGRECLKCRPIYSKIRAERQKQV